MEIPWPTVGKWKSVDSPETACTGSGVSSVLSGWGMEGGKYYQYIRLHDGLHDEGHAELQRRPLVDVDERLGALGQQGDEDVIAEVPVRFEDGADAFHRVFEVGLRVQLRLVGDLLV